MGSCVSRSGNTEVQSLIEGERESGVCSTCQRMVRHGLRSFAGCSVQEAFVIFDTNRNLHAAPVLRLPNAVLQYSGNGFLDQTEFYRFLVSCDSRVLDLAFPTLSRRFEISPGDSTGQLSCLKIPSRSARAVPVLCFAKTICGEVSKNETWEDGSTHGLETTLILCGLAVASEPDSLWNWRCLRMRNSYQILVDDLLQVHNRVSTHTHTSWSQNTRSASGKAT